MDVFTYLEITTKERKIYETLNEFGTQSANNLVKTTKIPSSKIYFMLDTLTKKGLITHSVEGKRKIFTAMDPNALTELIDIKKKDLQEKEKELTTTIQALSSIRSEHAKFLDIQIYEGIKGIKAYHEKILRIATKKDSLYLTGSTKITSPTLRSYFRQFHTARSKKGITFHMIKKIGLPKVIENYPHTNVRYLDQEFPTTFFLFRDSVAIIIYNVQPTLIRIRNKALHKSFKGYFNTMWKSAKVKS
jgi:sugar-specific transcriptional regulator TrmB